MRATLMILISLALSACQPTQHKVVDRAVDSEALRFLESSNHIYSTSKKTIPGIVKYGISEFEGYEFRVGDINDLGKINLSDVIMPGDSFRQRLNFVLKNDSFCLISYTRGGIGTHDIVDFVRYQGFKLMRYTSIKHIKDTTALASALLYYDKPDTIWVGSK